jgi:cGMP-dependent protein kinase
VPPPLLGEGETTAGAQPTGTSTPARPVDLIAEAKRVAAGNALAGGRSRRSRRRREAGRRGSTVALADEAELTSVVKSDEQTTLLLRGFQRKPVFAALPEATLHRAVDVMYKREVGPGTVIIQQGDDAEAFYVIESGEIAVSIDGRPVRTLGPADGLGELGVLYRLPRSASCVASSACVLWVLDRKPFKRIVVDATTKRRKRHAAFLQTVPLFRQLPSRKLERLADALGRAVYTGGEVIIQQGEAAADGFFLIEQGQVLITDEEDAARCVRRGAGDYFGELALLKDAPRTATVAADGKCCCLTLDRASFARLIRTTDVDFRSYDDGLKVAQSLDAVAPVAPALEATAPELPPDLVLEDFSPIGPTVGEGGYGKVFLARWDGGGEVDGGKVFAIKAMSKATLLRERQLENLAAELEILKLTCGHPFLCSFAGTWSDDRHVFIAMEYVRGGELYSFLRANHQLPDAKAVAWGAELVVALETLHASGAAYRDLKPENILVDSAGHLTLVDFGLSKLLQEGKTYTMCGTLDYMAPEVILNAGHDEGADWWSLGNVLFELLTGLPAFYCDGDDLRTVQRILKRKLAWPEKLVFGNARDLIDNLLQVDTTKRLGCLAGGAEDVKQHYWFQGLAWAAVTAKQIEPPWVPAAAEAGDEWAVAWYRQDGERDAFAAFDAEEAPELPMTQQALFAGF